MGQGGMIMNIVVPMAGRGERFRNHGFEIPKPIIDVNGVPMIKAAIDSLGIDGNYIFIAYDYENESFNKTIKDAVHTSCSRPKIIRINYITQGPTSSILLTKELINNDDPLLIANCDQIMRWNSDHFLKEISLNEHRDGLVVTYFSTTEKNSYVELYENRAIRFAEKRVISTHSLNGIHYWKHGKDFVRSAEKMISKNIRVNNEFYISESYNQLIEEGLNIGIYEIPADQHYAIGTPEDLKSYLEML